MFALPVALLLAGGSVEARQRSGPWVAAWTQPPVNTEAYIRLGPQRAFEDEATTATVRLSAGGDLVRLRLTNELGSTPIRIAGAAVTPVDSSGVARPDRSIQITFDGQRDAILSPGAPLISDPLRLRTTAFSDLAVTLFYAEPTRPTGHLAMLNVEPIADTTTGDLRAAPTERAISIVSEVDVASRGETRVLVAFGDSITEGACSTPGANRNWPAVLARRLADTQERWSVVNAGISGNRLLSFGSGVNALGRFDRDVLSVAGVSDVLLLEGINDIGASGLPGFDVPAVRAEDMIQAYVQLAARAHGAGLRITIGTLPPFGGAVYFTPQGEATRQRVNAWIRSNTVFDGVIDFDALLSDPARPDRMADAWHCGDHLHPGDEGYRRMAESIDLGLLRGSTDVP